MARIYFRKLRSRRLYANQEAFQRVVTQSFQNEVRPGIESAMRARVAGWSVAVDFDSALEISARGISVYVFPVGEGARFWYYVSRGVRGHPIRPRKTWSTRGSYRGVAWGRSYRRAALRLHHYNAMTRPGNVYGRPKWKQFSSYRPYVPWWPGISPRYFEENVARELKRWFLRTMENTLRRAVRAAKREGR